MPRPGPKRPNIAVRLSQEQIDLLDDLAADYGATRSDLLREAIDAYLQELAP